MTFLELAQQIDDATKEVNDAAAIASKIDAELTTANIALHAKRDSLSKLTSQMKTMLGGVETLKLEDTAALKQLALEGQKLRNR